LTFKDAVNERKSTLTDIAKIIEMVRSELLTRVSSFSQLWWF